MGGRSQSIRMVPPLGWIGQRQAHQIFAPQDKVSFEAAWSHSCGGIKSIPHCCRSARHRHGHAETTASAAVVRPPGFASPLLILQGLAGWLVRSRCRCWSSPNNSGTCRSGKVLLTRTCYEHPCLVACNQARGSAVCQTAFSVPLCAKRRRGTQQPVSPPPRRRGLSFIPGLSETTRRQCRTQALPRHDTPAGARMHEYELTDG